MGFWGKLIGNSSLVDVLRLEIFMEFHTLTGFGDASVKWNPLYSHEFDNDMRPLLIGLLYARILTIVNKDTRNHLFKLIEDISNSNLYNQERTGFEFPRWTIQIGFGAPPQHIWPWNLHINSSTFKNPQIYKATMQASPINKSFGIN